MGKITIIMAHQDLCWRTPKLPRGDKQQNTQSNSSVWSNTAAESALERISNIDGNASTHTRKQTPTHTHKQYNTALSAAMIQNWRETKQQTVD